MQVPALSCAGMNAQLEREPMAVTSMVNSSELSTYGDVLFTYQQQFENFSCECISRRQYK